MTYLKNVNPDEIIDQIESYLREGWSIPYAKRQIAGRTNNDFFREVNRTDRYKKLLDSYKKSIYKKRAGPP